MLQVKGFAVGAIGTNCYLVTDEETKETYIVDPGGNGTELIWKIRELSLSPKGILLTHGHWDHILAVEELKKAFSIPVYAYEEEQEILEDPAKNLSKTMYGRAEVSIKADVWLKDHQSLPLGKGSLLVLATPGHTKGGCCYYGEEDKILLSGDTLFQGSVGRTDLYSGNFSALIRSVREQLMVLPDDVVVYPGHESATTIGYERDYNPYLGR